MKAVITDFDGTLVDTFEANFRAYCRSFNDLGMTLDERTYRDCFGLRFDSFMEKMGVRDEVQALKIRELKRQYYPLYFGSLVPNRPLIDIIGSLRRGGCRTAIASTARKENLMAALEALGVKDMFDLILSGTDVQHGKPDPEIYIKAMDILCVNPEETLIFEDSDIGVTSAVESGASCVRVTPEWFGR